MAYPAHPTKKMKQGMPYSIKEKTIIINVFKYFRTEHPENSVTDIVRKTAKATGCSEKSVFIFRKEEATTGTFREPKKVKIRTGVNTNSRSVKYDDSVRDSIRSIIYDLKHRNIVPSLKTISKEVNGNPQLPDFSRMTLRRLLFDMGFYYEKNGNKSILLEKSPDEINSENVPVKNKKRKGKTHKVKEEAKNIEYIDVKGEPIRNVNEFITSNDQFLPPNNCTFQPPMPFNHNVSLAPTIHNPMNHLHVPSNSNFMGESKVPPPQMSQQIWMYH